MQYEFIKLLADKKLLDSVQFIHSTEFKLYSSKLSIDALKRLFNDQIELNAAERNAMLEKAIETGQAELRSKKDDINYFGESIGRSIIIDKLVIEIFSVLHSFFDNMAQVINAILFAENGIELLGKVSYPAIVRKMPNFPEYNGSVIDSVLNAMTKDEYIYISDFNNIVKHRHQIFVHGKFNLFNGESTLVTEKFHKDDNFHDTTEALIIIDECYDFCNDLFYSFIDYCEMYYTTNENNYIDGRLYNPKTELSFETKEDAMAMKNVKKSIHYIELDSLNLKPEYKVLLVKPNDDIERFEIYNSTYDFIAVRDKVTKKNLAYLMPVDDDEYKMDDGRLVTYRKYNLETVNFEFEIAKKTAEPNIKVYPLLSDVDIKFNKSNV